MKAYYFSRTNDVVLSSVFKLLPELVAVGDRNPDIEAKPAFFKYVCAEYAREISRRSIGVVRAGGFRSNVPIAKDRCKVALIQYTKKVKNIPEVDHVKRARVWAGVDEHQVPPRHKCRGSDKHVRSTETKASSVCVARKR